MGADVAIYDRSIDRLRELEQTLGGQADTCYASTLDIEQGIRNADLIIGAVLVHGAKAPYVIRRDQLSELKPGAVLVDVSIDQGGCFETSRPTTHSEPTYEVDGIVHYCVANMPGAVPVTSTRALTNATLPYTLKLADLSVRDALRADRLPRRARHDRRPIDERAGRPDQGLDYTPPAKHSNASSCPSSHGNPDHRPPDHRSARRSRTLGLWLRRGLA